jgi:hypothetical protein
VREDYSPDGEAWDHFGFDQAHTRAFRWGEDGIAGICDREQRLCLALTLWNGHDPMRDSPDASRSPRVDHA